MKRSLRNKIKRGACIACTALSLEGFSPKSKALGTGGTAGLIVGAIAVTGAGGFVIYKLVKRSNTPPPEEKGTDIYDNLSESLETIKKIPNPEVNESTAQANVNLFKLNAAICDCETKLKKYEITNIKETPVPTEKIKNLLNSLGNLRFSLSYSNYGQTAREAEKLLEGFLKMNDESMNTNLISDISN